MAIFATGKFQSMSKIIKWLLAVVILLVILYLINPTLWGLLGADQEEKAVAQSTTFRAKIPVSAVIIRPKKIDNKISVTGSVAANEEVELHTEVSGIVKRIHFKEGSKVRRGDLLISLDDSELSAQLEKLRYTQKLYSDSEYRQRQLLEREAISQEEYEQALTELNTVASDIKVVQSQYNKTKIRAPFNGVIGLRSVSEGAYLTPSDPIAFIYNINPAKIDFSIPEKYSQKVQVGDEIRFITDALSDHRIGRIYAVEPQVDSETRTLRMRATSDNGDGSLLPGQFARVELIFNTLEGALMVPTEAVVPELGGHKVYLSRNGLVQPLPVEVGIRTESEVEVVQGLQATDTVITSGILQIRPGSLVELTIVN